MDGEVKLIPYVRNNNKICVRPYNRDNGTDVKRGVAVVSMDVVGKRSRIHFQTFILEYLLLIFAQYG